MCRILFPWLWLPNIHGCRQARAHASSAGTAELLLDHADVRRVREALPGPKMADAKEELAIERRCRRRQGMVPLAVTLMINVRQLLQRAQALDFDRLDQANDDAWVLQARRAVMITNQTMPRQVPGALRARHFNSRTRTKHALNHFLVGRFHLGSPEQRL